MSLTRRSSLKLFLGVSFGAFSSVISSCQRASSSDATDLLSEVKQRGKIIISTDANSKPASFRNSDGSWAGFDIDVGKRIAQDLGMQPEFLSISFDINTAGSWNGRWDINIGSMTVTAERKQGLLFTAPYYYTPASFVIHRDSAAASPANLAGKKVGVSRTTTYESYMRGTLKLEGQADLPAPPESEIVTYETETVALDDLALGDGVRLSAVLTALPTAQNYIDGGQPLKLLSQPVFNEDLAVALDRNSPQDSTTLQTEISKIIEAMHADGTLTAISKQWYGIDLTQKA